MHPIFGDYHPTFAFGSPTLVDPHFVLQIGSSLTATVLANVILRTVLAQFLS
ncbi:MAG: hypothetical protein HY532_00120 [Chloroflexi bacterium]|nr:hypothetical protein [Chloroflexota bacterium]